MNLNKTMNRTAPLLILVLLVAGLAAVAPATALKVSGARIALDITPGQTVTSPIGISIGTDEAEADYAIDVLGFGQSDDGSYTGLAASADTSAYTARPYITVDKPTVHLKPGERADVTATIAIPAGTQNGGRYAIIMVHPAAAASGQQTAFATAVAIPVLLTITGSTIDTRGDITGIATSTIEIGKPFTMTATLVNSGNYHYYGIVTNVTVADSSGAAVAMGKTAPMTRAIIPGNIVKSAVPVTPGLPEGMYRMTVRMETQDGAVLAANTSDLKIGNPVISGGNTGSTSSGAADATSASGVRATYSPGPEAPAVVLAAALGVIGGIKFRQRREKEP